MNEKRCHKCGAEWPGGKRQPGFKDVCAKCNAYLHCCKNCRHHRPSAHNQCYIPNTEHVGDRAGANFCDEFEFAARPPVDWNDQEAMEKTAGSFGALFADGPGDDDPSPSGFEGLFRP